MGDISIKGHSPILRQGFAVGGAVRRLARGLRGRKGREKDFKTHGKDVPTMAAKGGRAGLKHGGKPPVPGSWAHVEHTIHKPRKKKATGGIARGAKKAAETFTERAGGSEKGKPHSTKEGRIASGKRKISRFLQRHADKYKKTQKPYTPRIQQAGSEQPFAKGGHVNTRRENRLEELGRVDAEKAHTKKGKRNLREEKHRIRGELKKGGKADKNWIQKAVNPKHKGYCTPMTKKTCTPRRKALARTFKKMGRERKAKG